MKWNFFEVKKEKMNILLISINKKWYEIEIKTLINNKFMLIKEMV